MRSARLADLLGQSTADQSAVSLIKVALRLSGDPSVFVIDHRYICCLKVADLKSILQALRDCHGPSISYSTTGNKDVLIQRVLVALYPQHASVILDESSFQLPLSQPRPSNSVPGPAMPVGYSASSFAAIPPQMNSSAYAMAYSSGGHQSVLNQPSTSPRVQVHLRASAPLPHAPRVPVGPQAVPGYLKDAVARWSHPMFEKISYETFVFTHPVTNLQGALPFDKPQPPNSIEKILIVPFTRRGTGSNFTGFVPFQLQPGPSVAVSWNNTHLEIPKFVTVKSKLASAAIHHHPMFLPPSAPFLKNGSNRLVMTGGGSDNISGVAIMLVRPRRLPDLEALVRSHPMSKITKRPEFHQDDDCAATSTPVQLKDPLSFCRIQIPVKTVKCKHVQCFDLSTFIQYCERNGIWYCPCCPSKPGLSIDDVYVDEFFLNMIKDASAHDTNTVYLKPDGSWTTTDPDLAQTLALPPAPAQQHLPPLLQPSIQRIRVFPDGIHGGNSWLFELPVGSSVKMLKVAIEARYQLPHELFHLCWFERTISWPTASNQDQNQSNNSTPSPTILIDTNERPVRDDDIVLVFGQGQATQELALQNEAFYNMKWLVDRKHARAFFSFRLSPAKAEELYSILNMLVDDLNSNDVGEWRQDVQSRLDDCDLKLLATFAPSSQQDMQALLPQKNLEFWNSYHQIFLKSIIDYHQLGRNRQAVSSQAVSQSAIQPRNSHMSNGVDVVGPTAANASIGDASNIIQSVVHACPTAVSSGSTGFSSLLLSRAVGEQDAANRMRAAAEWLDARSDPLGGDDLILQMSSTDKRGSINDDDLPLVQQPQHLVAAELPLRMDIRPPAPYNQTTHATQGRSTSRQPGGGNGGVDVHQVAANMGNRQRVAQPSLGQKRPAPNSIGSSASNAIVIDDD